MRMARTVKTYGATARWSRSYRLALGRYLNLGVKASLLPARKLGRRAVKLGMETLDVAGIHKLSLAALAESGRSGALAGKIIARAKMFFAEAVVPIAQTHVPALKSEAREKDLRQTLHRRIGEAASVTMKAKRSVLQRRAAEAALRKSLQHRASLLSDAQRMQKHLRCLTRKTLATHDHAREETSRKLRDEIAETLLAIHVRLLCLKKAAETENIRKEELDMMQRMMKECTQRLHVLDRTVEQS